MNFRRNDRVVWEGNVVCSKHREKLNYQIVYKIMDFTYIRDFIY